MRGAASANWVLSGIYKQHAINAVDDNLFVNMLNKSGVSKDTLRWDWDTIYEIMSGPITI